MAGKNNSSLVEVRACTVASAAWSLQFGPNGCLFQNAPGGFLSGHDDGGQYDVLGRGANGWNQQFTVPGLGR